MSYARAIVDQFSSVIVATDTGLRPASYRRPIEDEPLGGSHRRFTIEVVRGSITRPVFGAGECPLRLEVSVRVAYARPGGETGNRQAINVIAGTDANLIADALTDERNWDRPTTLIRDVRNLSAGVGVDGKLHVVWDHRFSVEAMLPWPIPAVYP